MQSRKSKIYTLTRCSLLSALLCITSPFVIPFGVVPFTLAIMMVMLISNILSAKESLISVLVYIFLGVVGIPVFSGFQGGVNIITGPTGGFILSYVPVSVAVSLMRNKNFGMRIFSPFDLLHYGHNTFCACKRRKKHCFRHYNLCGTISYSGCHKGYYSNIFWR